MVGVVVILDDAAASVPTIADIVTVGVPVNVTPEFRN